MEHYGAELSMNANEVLHLVCVAGEHRRNESALVTSRWFDYRGIHPVQLTYRFAECYARMYREFFARQVDIDSASSAVPFEPHNIFHSRDLAAMYLSRQAADELGVRYDWMLRFVFGRYGERGWRYIPRPNQLYTEEILLDVQDGWKEHCRVILEVAQDKRYRNDHFAGTSDQLAHHAWLIEQCKARHHIDIVVGELVYRRKVLPEEVAVEHFGAHVLHRARRQAA